MPDCRVDDADISELVDVDAQVQSLAYCLAGNDLVVAATQRLV